jgi:hypothetical protein
MKKLLILLLLLFLPIKINSQILNVEGNRFYNDTNKLSSVLRFNYFLNQTDRKTLSTDLNLDLQYKLDSTNLLLALFDYAKLESNNSTINNSKVGHIRYNHKITNLITFEAFAQYLYNYYLEINGRSDIGTGIRIKTIHNNAYKVYNGFLIMKENYFNNQVSYFNNYRYDFYLSFNLRIADNVHFINTTYYQPIINNLSDYRILNESALSVRIFKHLDFEENINYLMQSVKPASIVNTIFTNRICMILSF